MLEASRLEIAGPLFFMALQYLGFTRNGLLFDCFLSDFPLRLCASRK